jgi:hypothetical protein
MRLRKRKSSPLVRDGFLFATLLLSLGLMNSCDETKGCVSPRPSFGSSRASDRCDDKDPDQRNVPPTWSPKIIWCTGARSVS